jgi:hypothetical protein
MLAQDRSDVGDEEADRSCSSGSQKHPKPVPYLRQLLLILRRMRLRLRASSARKDRAILAQSDHG